MRQATSTPGHGDAEVQRFSVLVADPDGMARGMTSQALYATERVAVVLSAGEGREARELARRYRPAVLVIDTALPCPCELGDVITEISGACPETKVVTTAACGDDRVAISALRAGAVGHVDKDLPPEVLAREVMRVADGDAVVPRRLTMELLCVLRETPETWRPVRSRLTTREWEVIDLLAGGAGTRQIADALVLSTTTVYSHLKSVSRKLGVHSRREAIVAAEELRREEALGSKSPTKVA